MRDLGAVHETNNAINLNRSYLPSSSSLIEQLSENLNVKLLSDRAAPFARDILDEKYPEMMSRFNELVSELRNQNLEVIERYYIYEDKKSTPLLALKVRDLKSGAYIIPNINMILEPALDNLREQRESSQKQVAARSDESFELEDRSILKIALEPLPSNAPLQLLFYPTSEYQGSLLDYKSTVPFVMSVQMSSEAVEQGLELAYQRLLGQSQDYSYIFDELLLPAVQASINQASNKFFGIREKPVIIEDRSQRDGEVFKITAYVPKNEMVSKEVFKYFIRQSKMCKVDIEEI
jgi:hypothetical protein